MLLPLSARAQVTSGPELQPPAGTPGLMSVAASLLLVIGAILVLGWLYTRAQGLRAGGAGPIRVLAAQALGTKERIVVVEVGGTQLVVGVTASQISTLHTFDGRPVEPGASVMNGAFASRLRSALGSRAS